MMCQANVYCKGPRGTIKDIMQVLIQEREEFHNFSIDKLQNIKKNLYNTGLTRIELLREGQHFA